MKKILFKIIFLLIVSVASHALPGDFSSTSYKEFYGENIGGFCQAQRTQGAVSSLLKNLDVFSCSEEVDPKNFCDCLSKISNKIDFKKIQRVSAKVSDELSNHYAKEMYENDKKERDLAKLTNIFRLKRITNSQLVNCIDDSKQVAENKALNDIIIAQNQLVSNYAIGSDVFGSVTELTDLFNVAEDVFVKTKGLYIVETPSGKHDIDKVIEDAVRERLQTNNGHFFSTDLQDSGMIRSGVVSDYAIKEHQRVLKNFFVDVAHYGNSGMSRDMMRESIKDYIDLECRSLNETVGEGLDSEKVSQEEREYYFNKGRTEAYKELKDDPAQFLREVKQIRDSELSKDNNISEIERLEQSFIYDVAYCSIQGKFDTSVQDVIKTVKTEGEELRSQLAEIIDKEEEVVELAREVTELGTRATDIAELLKGNNDRDDIDNKLNELAIVQEKRRVASKLQVAAQQELAEKTSQMYERLGSFENYHTYRSAVVASDNGKPLAIDIVDGKLVVKTEEQFSEETNEFYDAERDRIKGHEIFKAHDKTTQALLINDVEEERSELLELNSAISDGEYSKLSSFKESKIDDKINSLVSQENIKKNISTLKKKYVQNTKEPKKKFKRHVKQRMLADDNFDRVVNTLSRKKSKKRSVKPSRADRAIDRIVKNPVKSEEKLNSLANEIQEKEKRLARTLAPLKENLEKVTKDSKAIESEISDIEELIKNNKSKKKESVSTSAPSRDVRQRRRAPRKQSIVEAPTSQTQTTFSSSTPADQSVIEPEYSTDDSRVSLFKEELQSGVKVITLNEFKKASNSDLSIKPGVEDLGETFIVDSAGVQVLFKTIYKDGKAIGYEMVETVSKDGLAKSLVSDKVEILDLKQELYKYSDFIKKLNSIPIE